MSELASGWTVPGYTEMKTLGAGGFGAVVLARHDATGTPVAIKFLRPDLLADQDFAAMFRTEAVTLGAVDSPYVVRLYEYVEAPAGAAIVMELVDGVSLQEIVTRQGKTTPEAALVVLYGSLLGLAAAHARGVVHRDFKPANVLVNAYGASKLTDFGIAARAGSTTIPAGSLSYAPPEQFDGGPATPASDVYAATATFYECLTGHPPFRGNTADELIREHRSASVPLAAVPEALRPIVAAGMAKDPRQRPVNAATLAAELRTAAYGAYGADWAERGRSHLGEAAVLLAALWPTGGAPSVHGFTAEQVQLSRGQQAAGNQHVHGQQVSHGAQHNVHQWHVLHREHVAHLRHLRWLRTATAAVAACAIVAAGITWARTRPPSGNPGSDGHAVLSAYPLALETVPIAAASSESVTGDTVVYYNSGSYAQATISGTIKDATAGQVVRLYARQFPYTGAPVLAGTATLSPSGGAARYSFQVTPTLATRYQAELFSGAAASTPIGQSAATTVYVVLGSPYVHVNCQPDLPVCSIQAKETFYAPAALVAKEMAKHWYLYLGVNIQPGPAIPPNPATIQLGGLGGTVGNPQRTGSDSFTLTITYHYTRGTEASEAAWWACAPDTEAQDGLGLPGSHGCGTKTTVTLASTSYLG
ncbi:MAG TPA: serine/threonine-protein kinase [Trebonia sp.]